MTHTNAHVHSKETEINEQYAAQTPQPAGAVEQPKPWSTPGSWTIITEGGSVMSGYLPAWAEDDPSETAVPLDLLPARLSGINHRNFFEGTMTPLTTTDSTNDAEEDALFEGSIDCNPYDPDTRLRVPLVNIQVCLGRWILGLDPQQLTDIAAKLRAQADRLHDEVLPALIAARDDWATHQHSSSPSQRPPRGEPGCPPVTAPDRADSARNPKHSPGHARRPA